MFTDSNNSFLLYGFLCILVPSTGFLIRYLWGTRWWGSPAGRAFAFALATSWFNYTLSAAAIRWPEWSAGEIGSTVRALSRYAIAVALLYGWFEFERANRRVDPNADTPSAGLDVGDRRR